MERLTRWLQKRALLSQRRVSLEEALLGGRFLRYARYRLVGFGFSRLLGALTHVLEFTFLIGVFRAKGIVASLALQNTALLAEAFWWGCLEIMRARIRRDTSKSAIANRISLWLTWSVRIALLSFLGPCAISLAHHATAKRSFTVLDAYAIVCGFRLAIDLVARTYYSGVYALQRVHRPLASILVTDPLGLVVILVLWTHLGVWSFPIGLASTIVLSRGLVVFYTTRMYKLARLPLPRVRLRARRDRTAESSGLAAILHAGAANLSSRVGSMLVLVALIAPLLTGDEPSEIVLALHLSATLLASAAYWAQVFYHDFRRLEDDAYALLQRRLSRALVGTSLMVGLFLWVVSTIAIATLLGSLAVGPFSLLLLPVFLSMSYLSTLQLRDFVRGQFSRLLKSAVPVSTALAAVIFWGNRGTLPIWSLTMTAALMSGVVVLWVSSLTRPRPASGVQPSLLKWVRALVAIEAPVRVGRASTRDATATHCALIASRLAVALGERGASVVVMPSRRVLWFERAPGALQKSEVIVAGAGKLQSIDCTQPCQSGRAALEAATAMGLVAGGAARAVESSASGLVTAFRVRFADRAVVTDLMDPRTVAALTELPPPTRRAIWQDAAREARQGTISRQRSGFEVSSFRPAGQIRLLFVVPLSEPAEERRAWRDVVRAANWEASADIGGDRSA